MKPPLLWIASVSALWCGVLAGCMGSDKIGSGPEYPLTVPQGRTLNIQAIRRETVLELTNTTGTNFGPSTLWLNRRFSYDISGLAVGETLRLTLSDFKDRFGESFRGGGFFAMERPEMLATAEIQTEGRMLGFVVVGGQE